MTKKHSFLPLYSTNFLGVLNDNFLKTLASFVIVSWVSDKTAQCVLMGAVAATLVLPYIVLSPLADRLTVVFSKVRIVRLAKLAEIPIVLIGVAGFAFHSSMLVVLSVFIIGVQAALFSPAKYALIRDIGGVDRISTGMGGMEGFSFLAMLAGTVLGSLAKDHLPPCGWYVSLLSIAALGILLSRFIFADEETNRAVHSINPLRYCVRAYRMARRYPGLNAVIFTLSVFWFAAAMLQMGLLVYGQQVLGLDAAHTGAILVLAAVGIVAGQIIAGFVDRKKFLLAANLPTGWIGAAILVSLFCLRLTAIQFAVLVGFLAFDMGFFKLPLDAEIQKLVKGPRLNAMLAYFNQISFLFMMAASLVYMVVSWAFGPRAFLLVIAVALFVTPVFFAFSCRRVLAGVGHWVLSRRYDVRKDGFGVFDPPDAPYLVLPNHVAMIDPMLILAELRDVETRPLCDELYFSIPIASSFLKTYGAVKVPDLRQVRNRAGVATVKRLPEVILGALESGKGILFYPSGHIRVEDREEIGTRQLAHAVCSALPSGVRVICVRTHGLWGSSWSRAGKPKTPDFLPLLVRSVISWLGCLVTRRRRTVDMHFEDMTDRIREWSALPRVDFNRKLEEWYNA